MAIRTFGPQTVGAASQPCFGTTLTAAAAAPLDPYKGTNRPGTNTPPVVLTVASNVGFQIGDHVLCGAKANFTRPNSINLDQGYVSALSGTTSISIVGFTKTHASGDYLVLAEIADFVSIIPLTVTGAIYLGTASTVSATDASTFAGGNANYWANTPTTGSSQAQSTADFWLYDATAGDTFIPRFDQI